MAGAPPAEGCRMSASRYTDKHLTVTKATWRNQVAVAAAQNPMAFLVAYVLSEKYFSRKHFIETGKLKAWPKQETLAEEVGVGVRAVARALAWLSNDTQRHLK